MAPHPPLWRAYFSTPWSHKHWEKTVSRDFSTFLRALIFWLLIFFLLIFFLLALSLLCLLSPLLLHLSTSRKFDF